MPTAKIVSQETATLSIDELERLIRRVVREEVTQALEAWGLYEEPTLIEPGSPIHEDLVELLKMKEAGALKLLSSEEVWETKNDLRG